jgi:methanogenic corrinoid protein MtbC1
MTATLNIAALTRRTGVPPDTIRKWEQRYGVLEPARTPGGQRRYSELDVARVEWLKARLGEGYRIGEAATLLGSGYPVVAGTPTELATALVEATVRSDVNGIARLVEQALSQSSIADGFIESLAPALVEIGAAWSRGEIDVAQEHLASSAVRSGLQNLLSDARSGLRGTAVLACGPGEQHEIGLMMLAVLLRADGWQVAYLGPNTPLGDAFEMAASIDARALCLSVTMAERRHALTEELTHATAPTALSVLIGGAAEPKRLTLGATVASLRSLTA